MMIPTTDQSTSCFIPPLDRRSSANIKDENGLKCRSLQTYLARSIIPVILTINIEMIMFGRPSY